MQFYYFRKKIVFFFETDPYSLRGTSKFFLSKISSAVEKYLVWQSFRCLSAISAKWDQKPKRGKPKNEKVGSGVGRVLEKIREFFGPPRVQCKKPFGNRLRVSRSKIDFEKWRLNFKWPNEFSVLQSRGNWKRIHRLHMWPLTKTPSPKKI